VSTVQVIFGLSLRTRQSLTLQKGPCEISSFLEEAGQKLLLPGQIASRIVPKILGFYVEGDGDKRILHFRKPTRPLIALQQCGHL